MAAFLLVILYIRGMRIMKIKEEIAARKKEERAKSLPTQTRVEAEMVGTTSN